MKAPNCRAIWISDVHLGTQGCKAALLLDFLKSHRCRTLYLVGDIIDGWRISTAKWYWPSAHNQVVRQVLRKAEKEGTRVYYVTGNHDEFLRDYLEEHQFVMGNIEVVNEAFHITAGGEKLWVVHGDAYDGITRHHFLVELAGDLGYRFLLWSNRWVNGMRRLFKLPYWSLSRYLKQKVRKAVDFIHEYEHTLVGEAGKRGVAGVVCGHIHHAAAKEIDGVRYYNCGDWVESCTALVEDEMGVIRLVHWAEEADHGKVVPIRPAKEKEAVSA